MIKQHPRKLRAKKLRQRQYQSAPLVQTQIEIDPLEIAVIPICVTYFRVAHAIFRAHAVAIVDGDRGTPQRE